MTTITEPEPIGEKHIREEKKIGEKAAGIYSVLLHPFIMPTYGVVALLYGPAYISILPGMLKLYIVAIFLLSTLFFPAFTIGVLKYLKIIPDLSLTTQRERTLPLLVVAVGYVMCYILLSRYLVIGLLPQLLIGAVGVIIVCFAVNLFWKISFHMAAIGGVIGFLIFVTMRGYGDMTAQWLLFTVLAGGLGTARLYLGSHTIMQVLAGFCGGVGVMLLLLNIF